MPTGVYPRKPRAAKAIEKPVAEAAQPATRTRKKRAAGKAPRVGRKALQAAASGPRFGVFEDGTIEVRLPSCSGVVGTDDARALVGFLRKIGVDA